MKVTLLVRAPKKPEKRVVVERDVVIGRGKNCNLQVLSNDVSRQHCRLVVGESDVAVRDLGSGNGTLINNRQTEPNIDAPLISGDIVRIGPLVMKVEFESATSQQETTAATPAELSSEAGNTVAEPAVSHQESPTEAPVSSAVEPIKECPALEPLPEPANDAELLPADELAEGEVKTSEFAEDDGASLDSAEPAVDEPPLSEQQPGKMKSLFGMFARKKKAEQPDTQTEAVISEEQSNELTADATAEPLLVADNADFDEETVVFDQQNAFTADEEELELLADDDEGLSDEGDYLDEVQDETADPGFADFLNNVDPPPS